MIISRQETVKELAHCQVCFTSALALLIAFIWVVICRSMDLIFSSCYRIFSRCCAVRFCSSSS